MLTNTSRCDPPADDRLAPNMNLNFQTHDRDRDCVDTVLKLVRKSVGVYWNGAGSGLSMV